LSFEAAGPALKAVIPIFGAHPLSNVFNRRPILLVEGEDDERIWQQAYRTSQGEINVWPCPAGDIQSLNEYEEKARSILGAVYDDAVAFSLRDRDVHPYHIDDLGPVIRMRLNCKASENLILTDDVLEGSGTDWSKLKSSLEKWLAENVDHPQHSAVVDFKDGGWDRRNANLKPLRILLLAVMGSQKPWEVAVGQTIAQLKKSTNTDEQNSLRDFLGKKLVLNLKLHL